MSLFKLARRNLMRHPIRSFLTIAGATVALFLLVFLRSIVTSLDDAIEQVSSRRVITASAVSLYQSLPPSYQARIASVPGVESVSRFTWFGGRLETDEDSFFGQFACDAELFLQQYPECKLSDTERRAFIETRQGAIVGRILATRFGWKIGDRVPLKGTIFPMNDGSAWEFDIVGIYDSTSSALDESTMYFHYDYFEETVKQERGEDSIEVGVYLIRIDDADAAPQICEDIDALYENGPQKTLTQPESAFQSGFISMLGNLPLFLSGIGLAVVLALGLSMVNTMLISARERLFDIGVLKAFGFKNGPCANLLLMESLVLSLTGGIAGIVIAVVTVPVFRQLMGTNIPNYAIRDETLILGLVFSIAIGLIGGLIPAYQAAKLDAADALREEA